MKSAQTYCYEHPRPALAVDAVVFALDGDQDPRLKILLIERGIEPFLGRWALPGGFLQNNESAEQAVCRELEEETGLRARSLLEVGTFSNPDRDPREHVVSIAFLALVRLEECSVRGGSDSANAAWFGIDDLPELAFDHETMAGQALGKLRQLVNTEAVCLDLLPEKFPLRMLQSLHEQVADTPLDKRNFRRKMLETEMLIELDEYEIDVQHRAARLYKFDKKVCARLRSQLTADKAKRSINSK